MRAVLALLIAGCATMPPALLERQQYRETAYSAARQKDLSGLRRALTAAQAGGDRAATVRVLEDLLAANPADALSHLEMARALHFDHGCAATWHEELAYGFLQSILASGEGTFDKPWRVFDAREEEAVMAFLDLKLEARSTVQARDRNVDLIDCRDPHGAPRRLHFDITPPG